MDEDAAAADGVEQAAGEVDRLVVLPRGVREFVAQAERYAFEVG